MSVVHAEPPRLITVVIHDVAPATLPACRRLIALINRLAPLPLTLLVVPRHHGARPDAGFERWLDAAAARGDELALHGFTHRDDGVPHDHLDHVRRRWYTAGEGEFAALDYGEAALRIDAGQRWFMANNWPLHGFVAPAWLMSEPTRQALSDRGFAYSATLSRLIKLPAQEMRSQALVYSTRSAWRRQASLLWNRGVAFAERRQPLLRLELHPGDADHARIRVSWLRLLEAALRERQALTVANAVLASPAYLWRERPLRPNENDAGCQRADAATDENVARVMQAERDARGGNEQGEKP